MHKSMHLLHHRLHSQLIFKYFNIVSLFAEKRFHYPGSKRVSDSDEHSAISGLNSHIGGKIRSQTFDGKVFFACQSVCAYAVLNELMYSSNNIFQDAHKPTGCCVLMLFQLVWELALPHRLDYRIHYLVILREQYACLVCFAILQSLRLMFKLPGVCAKTSTIKALLPRHPSRLLLPAYMARLRLDSTLDTGPFLLNRQLHQILCLQQKTKVDLLVFG